MTDKPAAPAPQAATQPAPLDPPHGGAWVRDPDTGVLSPAANPVDTADTSEN